MAETSGESEYPLLTSDLAGEIASSIQNPLPADSYDDDYGSETDSEFENDIYINDAQRQWDENMKQIETAVFYVLCPVVGKMIGRKTAQSLWARFVTWRWNASHGAVQ